MTTEFSRILYQVEAPLATILLNRPDKRNALDDQTLHELRTAVTAAGADPAVRVILLKGAGKDFCAGADLSALEKIAQAGTLENISDAEGFMQLFVQMRYLPKPIVAQVTGRALAGGCGLASACDVILAAESAQFGYPEVKIGFIPAMVMAILRRNISEKRAFDWMAIGDPLSAQEGSSPTTISPESTTPPSPAKARLSPRIPLSAPRARQRSKLTKPPPNTASPSATPSTPDPPTDSQNRRSGSTELRLLEIEFSKGELRSQIGSATSEDRQDETQRDSARPVKRKVRGRSEGL